MAALDDKVALITGASSGIGEATARSLAEAGAAVALAARRKDRIDSLAEEINGNGGKALSVETDITEEEQARAFVESARDELGGIDILVNNAGVMLLGPVHSAETEEWRRMIEVNALGLLYCTHAALPAMAESGGGHIVNVASTAGRNAFLGAGVYNFTKFGVVGFSESLRQEALHSNVRVTVIEPGFVDTELQGHNTNPMVVQATEKAREEIGDLLQSEDIAAAILYSVSQPPHVAVNEILIRPTKQQR